MRINKSMKIKIRPKVGEYVERIAMWWRSMTTKTQAHLQYFIMTYLLTISVKLYQLRLTVKILTSLLAYLLRNRRSLIMGEAWPNVIRYAYLTWLIAKVSMWPERNINLKASLVRVRMIMLILNFSRLAREKSVLVIMLKTGEVVLIVKKRIMISLCNLIS